jgi:thioredoxin reductase/NAD-dependent dihydropyrimidine dehydrogenase PreA subunit
MDLLGVSAFDPLMTWILGVVLVLLSTGPVVVRLWRQEKKTDEAEAEALEYGLNEPASLHPVIDPELCIGTGNCVDVCPEAQVIGFRHGQAIAIAPACCIGHGLCERACPMEAIQLVFGTKKRGVDIPRIREDFQTNVPGLYIIGELGGMGLIRNAFEQGRQCIQGILANAGRSRNGALDLVIVGAGPGGLSASLHAKQAGLRFLTLDKEPDLGGTVRHYPRKKLVMTEPVKVPGFGKVGSREILKEELIALWTRIAREAELPIRSDRTVHAVRRDGEGFVVETNAEAYRARRVILAIGRRGIPRKLGVPGEDLPNVQYALAEPESFQGDRILVVGGGDSAVEAAVALSEQPRNAVRVSYRRDRFSRVKPKNRMHLEEALRRGRIEVHWSTALQRIEPSRIWLSAEDASAYPLDNDQVFIFAGGELPTGFLRECGVRVDTKFGAP